MLKVTSKRRRTKEQIEADKLELQKKQKLEEDQAKEIQRLRKNVDAMERRNADADEKYAQYTEFFKNG